MIDAIKNRSIPGIIHNRLITYQYRQFNGLMQQMADKCHQLTDQYQEYSGENMEHSGNTPERY